MAESVCPAKNLWKHSWLSNASPKQIIHKTAFFGFPRVPSFAIPLFFELHLESQLLFSDRIGFSVKTMYVPFYHIFYTREAVCSQSAERRVPCTACIQLGSRGPSVWTSQGSPTREQVRAHSIHLTQCLLAKDRGSNHNMYTLKTETKWTTYITRILLNCYNVLLVFLFTPLFYSFKF